MNDDASYEHIVVLSQAAARLGMELAAKICMDLDLKRGKATHDYLDCAAAIRERARK
jgi:hypothetical protein